MKKIILFSFLLLTFGFVINAQSKVDLTYEFKIVLGDSVSEGTLKINLKNNDEKNVISNYEVSIPIKNSKNFKVVFDGKSENNFNIQEKNGFQIIKVDFSKPIIFGELKTLEINFQSSEMILNKFGVKQLFIPNPFSNFSKNIKYSIIYPNNFGDLFRIYSNQKLTKLNDIQSSLEVESNNGIYLIWANEIKLNISSEMTLRNENDEDTSFLLNLPIESSRQKIYIESLNGIEGGRVDSSGSFFGLIKIPSKGQKEIDYSINVKLSDSNDSIGNFKNSGFKFNVESEFGKEVIEATKNYSSNYEKLKIFNILLKDKVSGNKQAIVSNFDSIFEKLKNNTTLNSYEFSALNVSFAEFLGLKARIDFGYIFFSPIEIDLSRPQMWSVVLIDGKEVFIDSFMEEMSGISYFDIKEIDRIRYGTWHPDQEYNPAGGLALETNPIRVVIDNISRDYKEGGDVNISLELPERIESGTFFKGNLTVENNSSTPMILDKFFVNGDNVTDRIFSSVELLPVVLPFSKEVIEIPSMVENSLIFIGEKEFKVEVKFRGDEKNYESLDTVMVVLNFRNLLLISGGIFLTIVIIIFIRNVVKKIRKISK